MILVVEDDPQVARLISLVLARNGFQSEVVSDGESAMTRAREAVPELIFADLSIKGMGGEALCGALKAEPATRSIPFIVLSGDRDVAEKARQCGADDYMGKPFEFGDLVRILKKHARVEG
ncbi:MAG TPA: response regulator [Thermoanaerobaculia bacterium]|nr:response regulator [Thermoanaerobaculia bacterium]